MSDKMLKEIDELTLNRVVHTRDEMIRRLDILWEERDDLQEDFWRKQYVLLSDGHSKQHDKVVVLLAQLDKLLHENGELSKENALLRKENGTLRMRQSWR